MGKAWEEVVKLRASDAEARRAILEAERIAQVSCHTPTTRECLNKQPYGASWILE